MRANRLSSDKPYYRIVLPLQEKDLKNKNVSDIIKTFSQIDSKN